MASVVQKGLRNRVLSAIPASEFALIASGLKPVDLRLGQTLQLAGDLIEHVYFPETGFISVMAVLSEGEPLEIGLIGEEGVAGVTVVLGGKTSYSEAMCQTGGVAHRMPVAAFLQVVERAPRLREILLKYANVFGDQVAQTAVCNAHHEVSQRLARWLLTAHDRSKTSELSLTQNLIATMLGVRRSTVTVAAGALQKTGLIAYQHGRITIINRAGLEAAACECYAAVVKDYRDALGADPGVVAAGKSACDGGHDCSGQTRRKQSL